MIVFVKDDYMSEEIKKKKRKRTKFDYIILVVAIGVFCFSAFKLGEIFWANHEEKEETNEMRGLAQVPTVEADLEVFSVNFAELQKINPDIVGWIVVKDTDISYPIVQGSDNDYYLNHTYKKSENYAGSIFMDYRASRDFSDQNTFIYGHNLYHGTMFAELQNYMKKDFFNAHPFVYLYTPHGNYKLQVFSAYTALDTSDSYQMQFNGEQGFANYINLVTSKSRYATDIVMTPSDKMVTLYTCSYEDGRNPENTEAEYIDDRYFIHTKVVARLDEEK